MNATLPFRMLTVVVVLLGQSFAQTANTEPVQPDENEAKWSFFLAAAGYLIPHGQSYGSPTFAADHRWLHLEARYNYEAQETGSLWAGYSLAAGTKLELTAIPMLGAVFGKTSGVAPGCELSLSYKRIELSSQIEYLFNTSDHDGSFLYSWNELVYTPMNWFHAGLVSQRTRTYHTDLDVQRGFSVGISHKKVDFTTYIFNAGWTDPTVVLAFGFKF